MRPLLSLAAMLLAIGFAARDVLAEEKPARRDLSGEWAVEWFDPKTDYRETIFINIRQNGDEIDGTGLDPELIPSFINGSVKADQIKFGCKPTRDPLPFRAPPFSTFDGKVTNGDAMQGTWQLDRRESLFARRLKGTWTAKRTRVDGKSTVTMTRKTEIIVQVTSDEYDLLRGVGASPSKDEQTTKESHRRGDDYHVRSSVSLLLNEYRNQMDIANIGRKDTLESKNRRALCQKIESALHAGGYPWRLDKNSRTLVSRTMENPAK